VRHYSLETVSGADVVKHLTLQFGQQPDGEQDPALKSVPGCTVDSRMRSLPIMAAGLLLLRRPVELEKTARLSSVYGSYSGRWTCRCARHCRRDLEQGQPGAGEGQRQGTPPS
jgi:hypothetical protein